MIVFWCQTTAFDLPRLELAGSGRIAAVAAGVFHFAALVLAGSATAASAASREPVDAEYAIRWNAREGGPKSAAEALALLNLHAKRSSRFDVDYYHVPSTVPPAPGFSAILRRRTDAGGQPELTWKLRGNHVLDDWTCPLRRASKSKAEVDITFDSTGNVARSYSYSCKGAHAEAEVSALAASIKPCVAQVNRWERGDLKVEEWRLAGGVLMIEVSGNSANTEAAQTQFRKRVVAPLLAAGVVPAASSKTELGGRCESSP